MEYRLEDNSALFRSMFSMVERVATGFGFTEGPLGRGDHLVFSDIPNTTVRYKPLAEGPEVTTFRHPTGNANGMTLDRQGNLIACEHTTRRVARIDASGEVTTVVDAYQGKRFNSPNDVIVRSDGTIFFTDPPYGLPKASIGKELPYNGVFRLDPDGTLHVLREDFVRPDGFSLFSPDEKTLYVDDSARFTTFGRLPSRPTAPSAAATCGPS